MHFVAGSQTARDRAGGLPTHLPPAFPRCADTGEEMSFLMQLYCGPERLRLDDALCIQLYQCANVGEGEDPLPLAVKVPLGAELNRDHAGGAHPLPSVLAVEWETRLDPDVIPREPAFAPEVLRLYDSKAGGAAAFQGALPDGARFLFQLNEEPAGFNFGGLTAVVYEDSGGGLGVSLQ